MEAYQKDLDNASNAATSKHIRGFTIIEVLLVLAIAGMIMIVLFLAVPALQRNSRNQQYRSETGRLVAATQEFINNNNSNLPTSSDGATILANANAKNITTLNIVNPGTTAAVTPTVNTATLETGVTCGTVSGTTVTPSTSGAPTRSIIIIYGIEKSDGTAIAQCMRA